MSPARARRALSALFLVAAGCSGAQSETPGLLAPARDPERLPAGDGREGRGPIEIQILAFNDFHGNLEPPSGASGLVALPADHGGAAATVAAGGAAFFAEHVARLRERNPNTVLVSAGDLIGGSPLLSALFHDEPTIEVMNAIGLDFNGVGNHEFDEGGAELLRMQYGGCHPLEGCIDGTGFGGARFTFLGANVLVDATTGDTLFPSFGIREFDGLPIAFVGLTLEGTSTLVNPRGVAGLVFRREAEAVNALIPELTRRGVRAIVVLIHEGGLQTGTFDRCDGISGAIVEIAQALDPAVDLVISGHTHAAYDCEIAGKRVTSALSFGRLVTQIDVRLDATGEVAAVRAENRVVTRDVPPNAQIESLLEKYRTIVAPHRDRVIGRAAEALLGPRSPRGTTPAGESALGNLIADAHLEATAHGEKARAEIAFTNPGGVRADLDSGPITFGEVFTIQPFGNNLITLSLTGGQIHQLLEQQFLTDEVRVLQTSRGFRYRWSKSAPPGQKIDPRSIELDGRPIDPARSYRVTVNSFLAFGGDGFSVLAAGTHPVSGPLDLDAVEAYLRAHDPVSAAKLDRIQVVP